jgi:hypothetical protein
MAARGDRRAWRRAAPTSTRSRRNEVSARIKVPPEQGYGGVWMLGDSFRGNYVNWPKSARSTS